MKKTIIIKESKLKEIMRECIKELVNENGHKINNFGELNHPNHNSLSIYDTSQVNVMEQFYGILSNGHKPLPLSESSIDRILNKHGNEGMAIISANRSDVDNQTNNQKTKELISDLRVSGFSYIPVYGGYHGQDDVVDSYEPSFVVTCFNREGQKEDINKLFNFAIKMCKKYNQDSILFKEPNGTPNYYDRNGNKVNSSSSNEVIKNDPTQEYFTSLIKTKNLDKDNPERSKRFTYDIQFEGKKYTFYTNPKPTTLNERIRRSKSGEIIL